MSGDLCYLGVGAILFQLDIENVEFRINSEKCSAAEGSNVIFVDVLKKEILEII